MDKKNNLIVFPHTIERQLQKAMEAGKGKQYESAMESFEQVLRIDSDNLPAKIGLAVTLIEVGRWTEAVKLTSEMMKNEEGDYYHILRIHLAALVQSERFDQLKELLLDALKRPALPTDLRGECEKLLLACETLEQSSGDQLDEALNSEIHPTFHEETEYVELLIRRLFEGTAEQQLISLEQLKFSSSERAKNAIKQWVKQREGDPFLKTIALRSLKAMGVVGEVKLNKWNEDLTVDLIIVPEEAEDLPEEFERVLKLLEEKTYHLDPTLTHFAAQVWIEYLFTVFPALPEIQNTEIWSAALHEVTARRLYGSTSMEEIGNIYQVDRENVHVYANRLEEAIRQRSLL